MSASLDVTAAAADLRAGLGTVPPVGIVLGSGLGGVVDAVEPGVSVPFEEIRGYPATSVAGHAGRYVAGPLGGADVLLQCGRFHAYEGHSSEIVAAPVRVAAAAGVQTLIFTNAAGGIRRDLEPGDLVMLDDHINWMFGSPLAGPVHGREERFPDMSGPYDADLRELARAAALEARVPLREGVYAAVLGPAFETPAEVRMLGRLGADVVGMSTVPEVIVARALGIRCLAFSVVTNKASGLSPDGPAHEEVIEIGRRAGASLAALLVRLLPMIGTVPHSGEAK